MEATAARNTTGALLMLALGAAAVTAGCGGGTAGEPTAAAAPSAGPVFEEVAAAAGIDHRHEKPRLDPVLDPIMPWVASLGAAAATADFDRDGRLDLYVTSSAAGSPNRLYRNLGPGPDGTVRFEDVGAAAGLASVNGADGASMDAVWGDVDNDGWPDLYLVRWGRDALFRNLGPDAEGQVRFADVTAERFRRRDGSPGIDWANGNGAIFLDADLDGRLDVYVGNYFREVDLWHLESTRIMHDDFEKARNGGRNFLYRQLPDGRFEEAAARLGVDDPGWTLAVASADVDNDGRPDLYSVDDFGPDQLFLNRGASGFENVTAEALGLDTKKGMNAEFGDFNNDGWLDAYVTNVTTAEYLQEGNMLWHNNGPGPDGRLTLTDVSMETGTYDGGWGWGAKFFDYDNDGDLDLVSLNGFISAGPGNFWYDLASWIVTGEDAADAANWPAIGDRSFSGFEPTRLWRNEGAGGFSEQARPAGLGSDSDGRGVVVFDFDDDGDLDLYFANQAQPGELYRSATRERARAGDGGGGAADAAHWLGLTLEGDPATGTNRDAVGTRVTVVAGGVRQIRERDGGNGFAGQSDPRLHFGLGGAERAELVEIRWPDGGIQILEDVVADRYLAVRQDPAAYADRVPLEVGVPEHRERRDPGGTDAAPPVDPAALDRKLAELEGKLVRPPLSHALAAAYRREAAAGGAHDRAIDFLRAEAGRRPGEPGLQLELGSALVDKVPTCGGLAAVVCKGQLAKKALDEFSVALDREPDLWAGFYARGINHLHWPRALRHSDAAAADLERAVELAGRGGGPAAEGPRLATWAALGDAHVKAGRPDEARRAWRRGAEEFPGSAELAERLAISDDDWLLAHVEDRRSLERPIDTDLSFLDPRIAARP